MSFNLASGADPGGGAPFSSTKKVKKDKNNAVKFAILKISINMGS